MRGGGEEAGGEGKGYLEDNGVFLLAFEKFHPRKNFFSKKFWFQAIDVINGKLRKEPLRKINTRSLSSLLPPLSLSLSLPILPQ
jgi:hypothetical protein